MLIGKKLKQQLRTFDKVLTLIAPAILKSFFWLSWNSIFGLGVLVPILILNKVISPTTQVYEKLTFEYIYDKVLDEGILMFFCNALMAAALADYILSKVDFGKVFVSLIAVALMVSFLITCFVFSGEYLFKKTDLNVEFLRSFQVWLVEYTIAFCGFLKTVLNYYEEKHQ